MNYGQFFHKNLLHVLSKSVFPGPKDAKNCKPKKHHSSTELQLMTKSSKVRQKNEEKGKKEHKILLEFGCLEIRVGEKV